MDRVSEKWAVYWYSTSAAEFGYDIGTQVLMHGLEPSVARSIARHMNKEQSRYGNEFWAEEEPQRWW